MKIVEIVSFLDSLGGMRTINKVFRMERDKKPQSKNVV